MSGLAALILVLDALKLTLVVAELSALACSLEAVVLFKLEVLVRC